MSVPHLNYYFTEEGYQDARISVQSRSALKRSKIYIYKEIILRCVQVLSRFCKPRKVIANNMVIPTNCHAKAFRHR